MLAKPLSQTGRRIISRELSALLVWQRDLSEWPPRRQGSFPDGVPIVSLYARGRIRGCQGSVEGGAHERLMRAFIAALGDPRSGPLSAAERRELSAHVSYPRAVRRLHPSRSVDEIEAGSDGVALVRRGSPPCLLLPQVARDLGLDARGLLVELAAKAGVSFEMLASGALFAFETDDVTVFQGERTSAAARSSTELAQSWLAARVDRQGRVAFAVDARRRHTELSGDFGHGRAAVVLSALHGSARMRSVAQRARRWLELEIDRALAGRAVSGWPREPARVAGTLALARLADVGVERPLRAFAARKSVRADPWHAAQVVTALGREAPQALYQACLLDLETRPWAPWTALAARARGDAATFERCARALIDSIRTSPPHVGGADVTVVPQLALTAIAIEALAPSPRPEPLAAALKTPNAATQSALRLARQFLLKWQLVPGRITAALDPDLATGAFVASPIADWLRTDVTAHVVLALRASEPLVKSNCSSVHAPSSSSLRRATSRGWLR